MLAAVVPRRILDFGFGLSVEGSRAEESNGLGLGFRVQGLGFRV